MPETTDEMTIEVRGIKYPVLDPNRMKRKTAKKLKAVMAQAEWNPEDPGMMEAPWEILEILAPTIPENILDDLDLGEASNALVSSGILAENPAKGGEITVGESLASTDS